MKPLTAHDVRYMLDLIDKAVAALTMVRNLPTGAALSTEQWLQVLHASDLGYVRERVRDIPVEVTEPVLVEFREAAE